MRIDRFCLSESDPDSVLYKRTRHVAWIAMRHDICLCFFLERQETDEWI